jgi:hypothetical protein
MVLWYSPMVQGVEMGGELVHGAGICTHGLGVNICIHETRALM